jgi:hypothetical protein
VASAVEFETACFIKGKEAESWLGRIMGREGFNTVETSLLIILPANDSAFSFSDQRIAIDFPGPLSAFKREREVVQKPLNHWGKPGGGKLDRNRHPPRGGGLTAFALLFSIWRNQRLKCS